MARLEILYSSNMHLKQLKKLLQKHGDVIVAVAVVVNGDSDRRRLAAIRQHYGLETLAVIELVDMGGKG